ncbi:hypothetical protein J6590_011441 [Homalodisca vitripennis]|nr:hypothetical protein J6590_011441 [Homalodisca vitripennis]
MCNICPLNKSDIQNTRITEFFQMLNPVINALGGKRWDKMIKKEMAPTTMHCACDGLDVIRDRLQYLPCLTNAPLTVSLAACETFFQDQSSNPASSSISNRPHATSARYRPSLSRATHSTDISLSSPVCE